MTSALTDGLLVIRYLFGFSGEALTNGALGSGAGRDASEIQDYLESISPDLGLGTGNGGPAAVDLQTRALSGLRGSLVIGR